MSARNDFKVSAKVESDCAPLNDLVNGALQASENIKFMRMPPVADWQLF